jgi:predicted nucleic acid-binding protein
MPLVVDASVTLSWCFRDEQGEYGARVLRRLAGDTVLVPGLWLLEVTNGLLVAERRGRLSAAELSHVRQLLADLPVTVVELALEEALGSVLEVARSQSLSAYDASYLDLAMRQGLPLATQDDILRSAAVRLGVRVVG